MVVVLCPGHRRFGCCPGDPRRFGGVAPHTGRWRQAGLSDGGQLPQAGVQLGAPLWGAGVLPGG